MKTTPEAKTYGHKRKNQVPDLPGTHPKPCTKCGLWFAAGPRKRLCDACTPNNQKARDLQRLRSSKQPPTQGRVASDKTQNGQVTEPVFEGSGTESGSSDGVIPSAISEAERFRELCRLWSGHAALIKAWLAETGLPVREYPTFGQLTAREVQVGISQVPWPGSWPERTVTPRQLKAVLDKTPAYLAKKRNT